MQQCNCISSNNALQCVECNRTYQCDTQCNAMQCNEFIAMHCNVMCALGALVVGTHPIFLKHSAVQEVIIICGCLFFVFAVFPLCVHPLPHYLTICSARKFVGFTPGFAQYGCRLIFHCNHHLHCRHHHHHQRCRHDLCCHHPHHHQFSCHQLHDCL